MMHITYSMPLGLGATCCLGTFSACSGGCDLQDLSVMRMTRTDTHTPFLGLPQYRSMGLLRGAVRFGRHKCSPQILRPLEIDVGSSHAVVRKLAF